MTYDASSVAALLGQCDEARDNNERGRALEGLVETLFRSVPGIFDVQRNSVNTFGAQEVDLGVWNDGHAEGLQGFEPIFLIECKNWTNPVGSAEVAWFDSKLRLRGVSFGVLIAMNGITGDQERRTAAHSIVASALSDRRTIVVITREDIESITSAADLVGLLKRKRLNVIVSGQI